MSTFLSPNTDYINKFRTPHKRHKKIYWDYVRKMIRIYPERREQYIDTLEQSRTPAYTGMPGGTETSRPTEQAVFRLLDENHGMTETEYKEYWSVHDAIEQLDGWRNGDKILNMIDMVYWDGTFSLTQAGNKLGISYAYAKRWNEFFMDLVAKNYGLT